MNTPDIRDDEIIGASLNNLKSIIETFALQGEKLLFLGGRGTGKELLAKLYKKYSKREKFIPINCAGISDSLLLSELFGHKKGAFTGADSDREGILSKWGEQAVIFLDEIGDASERFQAALLRVLETGDYTRVGEDDPRNIDLNKTRLVAATTKHRGIRSELLDRFICLTIPALSERQSDIPLFLKHFMKNSNIEYISKKALINIKSMQWDGNVRVFRQALVVAAYLCKTRGGKTLRNTDFSTYHNNIVDMMNLEDDDNSKPILIERLKGNQTPFNSKKFLELAKKKMWDSTIPSEPHLHVVKAINRLSETVGDLKKEIEPNMENEDGKNKPNFELSPKEYEKLFWEHCSRSMMKPSELINKYELKLKEQTISQKIRQASNRIRQKST